MPSLARVVVLVALLAGAGACRRAGPPYSPRDALHTFRLENGYRIELVAAEPDVVSPVAMEIDEDGRIYVVEDRGYPLETSRNIGRIKLLEDSNGDGRPERSTIFADNLRFPTGVMRWRRGVLVTDPPDVLYLEDADGDGRAEIRKQVLTGFAFTNPQHTVNNPVYGLDNWIYLAHEGPATAIIFKEQFADRGGDIRFADGSGPVVSERGRNIRFRPDTHELEALSSASQFGHAFDQWGRHFVQNNNHHLRQEVLAAEYTRRNPDLAVVSTIAETPDHGAAGQVYPITIQPRFQMLTNTGEFTSACGLTIYYGDAMPGLDGSAFTAEPVHNLVHRDILAPGGAAMTARRAHDGVEFLASTDSWFRPVNFYIGPGGGLFVMDYYRLVIEHPEWMSTHTHQSPELRRGEDRGRIYRVVPSGPELARRLPQLSKAADAQLVPLLADPNPWWRRTAQRLLVERQARSAEPLLRGLLEKSPSAVARLHALWTLDGIGVKDPALVERAMSDAEAGVRENAVRLAAAHLRTSPALSEKLVGLATDPDARVRFQVLAALGDVPGDAARAARERLLFDNIEDTWFQLAFLSASSDDTARLLDRMVKGRGAVISSRTEGRAALLRQTTAVIARRGKAAEIRGAVELASRTEAPASDWWRAAMLEGLANGMRRGASCTGCGQQRLLPLAVKGPAPLRQAALRLLDAGGVPSSAGAAVSAAEAIAADGTAEPGLRADAVTLLALVDASRYEPRFRKLVDAREPEPVQAAAVRGLGRIRGQEIGRFLIEKWRGVGAGARSAAADSIFRDPARVPLLVAALKAGDVQPWTLAFRHKRQLIMNNDPAIREAARPLVEMNEGMREAVVRRYEAQLNAGADAARGRAVFERACSKCHRLNGKGSPMGPDLDTVRHQAKEILLREILNPSRAISQGFEAWVVETTSGTFVEGVLAAQSESAVSLRQEEGRQETVLRRDIKQMYATRLSAMPADLDKQVTEREMADVLEYLKRSSAPGR